MTARALPNLGSKKTPNSKVERLSTCKLCPSGWWRVERQVSVPSSVRADVSTGRGVEVLWSNRPLNVQATLLDGLAGVA